MKPDPLELVNGQTYAITFYHDDGPLLGLIAEARNSYDSIYYVVDLRTNTMLTIEWEQLCTAQIVDGLWQTDEEVEVLLRHHS